MRNRVFTLIAVAMMGLYVMGAGRLTLKDVTGDQLRAERLNEVTPLADGETYAQISADGQRIVAYSFRTGKQTAVLFDAATARGPRVNRVDGYIVSPDGKRLLIQTQTKPIYRRSFTATYYIYVIQNNKLEPLSDGGPQQAPLFSPDGNIIAFLSELNRDSFAYSS